MLSKEEIEKAKRYFKDELHYEKTTYNCVNHYRQTIIDNHIVLYKYINQLESDKQKLIEKLEEDKETLKKENANGILQDYVIRLLEIVKEIIYKYLKER